MYDSYDDPALAPVAARPGLTWTKAVRGIIWLVVCVLVVSGAIAAAVYVGELENRRTRVSPARTAQPAQAEQGDGVVPP